jgi:hypothetical protein
MRVWIAVALSIVFVPLSHTFSQEPVPQDEAQKAAMLLAEKTAKLDDTPFNIKLDPAKPVGVKAGDYGALIIPAAELKAEDLDKVGEKPTPLAQLWLRQLVPFVNGSAIADSDLRKVDITIDDRQYSLPLLLLGVAKGSGGKLELNVYTKGTKPALTIPLEKADDAAIDSSNPITLDGRDNGDGTGAVILKILGKYEATVTVMPAEG